MDERTILIVSFGLGVALQVLVLLRGDWNWRKLAFCLALGVLGFLPGKHEHAYQPLVHVLVALFLFAVIFALTFKEDILPTISETVLLLYSSIFWFAFFSYYYEGTAFQNAVLLVLLVPTAATLFVACRKTQLYFSLKLILYTWFLFIIVSLGFFQFPYRQLAIFMADSQVPWTTPVESVSAGMAFLFLAANAMYIFYLVPVPGKGQSWKGRMREWHEFTDLVTARFDDSQAMRRETLAVLVAVGGLLLLNYEYRWLPASLLINVLIVASAVVYRSRASRSIVAVRSRSR